MNIRSLLENPMCSTPARVAPSPATIKNVFIGWFIQFTILTVVMKLATNIPPVAKMEIAMKVIMNITVPVPPEPM